MAFNFGKKNSIKSRLDLYKRKEEIGKRVLVPDKKGKKNIKKKVKKLFGVFLAIFFLLGIVGLLGVLAVVAHYSSLVPNPNEVFERKQQEYSTFYDRNGKELFKLIGSENRIRIDKLEDVPEVIKWTFIVSEDAEYYEHKGIDLVAIVRCAVGNISNKQKCGGSTITQQVLKNTVFKSAIKSGNISREERKIQEIIVSLRLEQRYGKDDTLFFYLNEINFGSNRYGLRTAANIYFNKEPKDLTLAEASLLAGIPNSPTKYDPYGNVKDIFCRFNDGDEVSDASIIRNEATPDILKDKNGNEIVKVPPYKCRQLYVLRQYEKNLKKVNEKGVSITQADIDNARKEEIKLQPNRINIKAPHFVFYAKDQLFNPEYNFEFDGKSLTLDDVETGGYKIYTTLDLDMQEIAEQEAKNWVDGTKNCNCEDAGLIKRYGVYNAAMSTIDPKTGEILMMVGSKDWFGARDGIVTEEGPQKNTAKFDPKVNILTSPQQTGSSHKPISYLAGIESGVITTSTFLPDFPVKFGSYEPQNAEGGNTGYNAGSASNFLRRQLRYSLNRPAILAADMMGVNSMLDMYDKLGYSAYKDRNGYGLSVILGAASVQPIEHFNAFAVLANKGKYHKPQAILKIVDRAGTTKWEYKPDEGKQVVDERAVYIMNDMLLNYGKEYATDLIKATGGHQVAAKTGTSNNNRDMYFIGYTPEIVTGVWVGNNNNADSHREFNRAGGGLAYGGGSARPLWLRYSKRILDKYPKTSFVRPAGVVSADVCLISGKLATEKCGGTIKELFIEGKLPIVDDSIQTIKVCTDKPVWRSDAVSLNKLARPIDEANGFAMDINYSYVKIGNKKEHQAMFDKSSGQQSPATTQCDTDYSTVVSDPTLNVVSPTPGVVVSSPSRTLNFNISSSGGVGAITSLEVFVSGVSSPIISTSASSVNQDFIFDSSFGYGNKTIRVVAKDASGKTVTQNIGIVLEEPVASGNLKYMSANTFQKNTTYNLVFKYSGSGTPPSSITLTVTKSGTVVSSDVVSLSSENQYIKSYLFSDIGTYTIKGVSGTLSDSKDVLVTL